MAETNNRNEAWEGLYLGKRLEVAMYCDIMNA